MQNRYTYIILLLLAFIWSFTSCSGNDSETADVQPLNDITLIITMPENTFTRVGDPGQDTQEGADWDELAVIATYTDGSKAPVKRFVSKSDYEKLPFYPGSTVYRVMTMPVSEGTIRLYGITYSRHLTDDPKSEEVAGNPHKAIDDCMTDAEVRALTISNDYASNDDANGVNKFLSVASGFYGGVEGDEVADYEVGTFADKGEIQPTPSIRLNRLAAKVDIEWDAQDAYEFWGYTDVKVENFTFYNNKEDRATTGKGQGRLFPELNKTKTGIGGQAVFVNQSAISKRNGRVYHYVFPDGVSAPAVTFSLSGKKDGTNMPNTYTFQFSDKLKRAVWYQVNTVIRGTDGNTQTISNNM